MATYIIKPATIVIPSDRAVLAYFAGILDGEGSLYLGTTRHLTPQISVANTNLRLIRWLRRTFGGSQKSKGVMVDKRGHIKNLVPCYDWRLTGMMNVKSLLEAAMPWLIIKKPKAIRMVAAIEYRLTHPKQNVGISGVPKTDRKTIVALRTRRLALGFSQHALCERAGVHIHFVSQLERGLIRATRNNLSRVASALGLDDMPSRGTARSQRRSLTGTIGAWKRP